MIVVSDTSPLNYLVLLNAVDVLPRLFFDVYTAAEVVRELSHERAPAAVREWAESPPEWLRQAMVPGPVFAPRCGYGRALGDFPFQPLGVAARPYVMLT